MASRANNSGWGNPDTRHINPRGHRDLAMLIASLIRDAACEMVADSKFVVPAEEPFLALDATYRLPQYMAAVLAKDSTNTAKVAAAQDASIAAFEQGWAEQTHAWREKAQNTQVGQLMPGMWMGPSEYGKMPRLRVLEGWNPALDHATPPFHPVCFSTRSKDPQFNLTPDATKGWQHWVHPDFADKPYFMSNTPGSTFSFHFETSLGIVKLYSLKSKTFGLGTIECWADAERDRAVKVQGYWDSDRWVTPMVTPVLNVAISADSLPYETTSRQGPTT
jgi:hypothetical protein